MFNLKTAASLSAGDTVYQMDFDFTTDEQRKVLEYLQTNDYELIGYKGAKGAGQVAAGLPTWFAMPFGQIFGSVAIDYTPKFKVYVFNRAQIAANTTIEMQSLSSEIGLGNALNFTQSGQFTSAGSSAPGTITLNDQRPAGSGDVTVGLAGLVNLPTGTQFLPFCAFTMNPLGAITMEPMEQVAIMAARVSLQSGNVQANAAAPGASLIFDASTIDYQLRIEDSTYQITNVPGTTPVTPLTSGQSLAYLNGG
jgi:hypothetical protein